MVGVAPAPAGRALAAPERHGGGRLRPSGDVGAARSGDAGRSGSLATPPATGCSTGSGLAGLGHEQSSTMPTGLARMVELARALAIGPKLLLLDEPGSGLDEAESKALGDLLAKLAAGGMAVLLVEHDMELVMRICDHIYVLDFGDIIASGTPDAIRNDPMVQAAYLGEAEPATATTAAGPAGRRGSRGSPIHEQVGSDVERPLAPPRARVPGAAPDHARPAPARCPPSIVVNGRPRRLRADRGAPRRRPGRAPGQRVRPARPQRRREVDPAQGDQRPHAADARARC